MNPIQLFHRNRVFNFSRHFLAALAVLAATGHVAFAAPPLAATQPALAITTSNAVLSGMVTPNATPTTAWFQWGQDTSYGNVTAPIDAGSGNGVVRVTNAISGLVPWRAFHFQLVASNSDGIIYGADQSLAVGKSIWVWGNNYSSQTNVPASFSNAVLLAGGGVHSLGLDANGNVAAWGNNLYAQTVVPPALANVTVSVAAGYYHSLALKNDGRVTAWGNNLYKQCNVPAGLSNVVAVAGGYYHSLALTASGQVVAWGQNSFGQTNVPAAAFNIVAIAAGGNHNLALRNDGAIIGWGDNSAGQINIPYGLGNVVALSAGGLHSMALLSDGTVAAWGDDSAGQTDVPFGLTGVVAIAAGENHGEALTSDGTAIGWGYDFYGQTDPPAAASKLLAIAAGGDKSLALGLDTPPTATAKTVTGLANNPLVIQLTGTDLENDALTFNIFQLPALGTLYQYDPNTTLGAPILSGSTPVTDISNRVVFVSDLNGFGNPYTSFQFVANDGSYDSAPAAITIVMAGPPFAATEPPTFVTTNAATLRGLASANNNPSIAWLEWGSSKSYGNKTTTQIIAANGNVTLVSRRITGLLATVPYHVRLVVSNQTGLTYGADQIFGLGKNIIGWGDDTVFQTDVPTDLTNNAVGLAAGYFHGLAVNPAGTVEGWGDDGSGQIDEPTNSNFAQVAAGDLHSVGLKTNNTVVVWGDDFYGQTNVPSSLNGVMVVAAGGYHTLALRSNGVVVAWGANASGQTNVPAAATNIVQVSAGFAHSMALKNNGTVLCWGDNTYGETNVPAAATNIIAVSAGRYFCLALKNDGSILAWGDSSSGQTDVPATLTNAVMIAAGGSHCLALRSDGSVAAWGFNDYGQANVPVTATNIISLAAGQFHSLALIGDLAPMAIPQIINSGPAPSVNLTLAGSDPDNDPITFIITSIPVFGTLYQYNAGVTNRGPAILTNNTSVTDTNGLIIYVPDPGGFGSPYATFQFAATDGLVASVPATVTINISGPVPPSFANTQPATLVTATSAQLNGMATPNGGAATAYFEWGTTMAYGNTTPTQSVGSATSVVRVSQAISGLDLAPPYHFRLVVNGPAGLFNGADQIFGAGKKVRAWGDDTSGQTDLPADLTNTVGVASGAAHNLALKTNGAGEGWGANGSGQTNIPALFNAVQFAGGAAHSLALLSDGTVRAWGDNTYGQTSVSTLSSIVAVAAGDNHNLALTVSGTVTAWGANDSGQINVPPGLSNIVAVAAGSAHSLALRNDGTVIGWGNNLYGQTNAPIGLTHVVAIAAGLNFSLALRNDGTVVAWGDNSSGQTTVSPAATNILAIVAGGSHALALKDDGTVVGWGLSANGQIAIPANATNILALSAGQLHSVAISGDNAPLAAAQNIVSGPTNRIFITLTATDSDNDPLSFAIATLPLNGALYQNNGGAIGALISTNNTPVTDPGNGVFFVPGPGAIGSPYATFQFTANDGNYNSVPATISLSIITTFPPYAATQNPTLISTTTARLNGMATANYASAQAWFEWGATSAYGNRTPSQSIGSNAIVIPITADLSSLIATIPYHCRLVVSNQLGAVYGADKIFGVSKKLWSWGDDSFTQLDFPVDLTGNVSGFATGSFDSMAIKTDFTGEGWGDNSSGEVNLPGANNIIQLAGGDFHSVALLAGGTVAAWGDNSYGQTSVPTNLAGVTAIAAGGYHSLALMTNGTVAGWGANVSGQINVPPGLSNVVAVAAGFSHSMALRNDGSVLCWGDDSYGQSDVPATASNITVIAAGRNYSLALTKGGLIIGWGDNSAGQLSIPAAATNVVALAAGGFHVVALRQDGSMLAWGFNNSGQAAVPISASNIIAIAAGEFHSLAMSANNAPSATPQTISSPQIINLPITLSGTDPDGDLFTSSIAGLPSFGTLYQFNAGQRGVAILATNTPVTDPGGQVIFVPEPGAHGTPYASFQFTINDGIYTSTPGLITINIVGPPPSTNQNPAAPFVTTQTPTLITKSSAVLNGMATANFTPTIAWFEWGTTTNYGNKTPLVNLATNNGVSRVSLGISNLIATIPYHFRIVASNQVATVGGADQVFGVAKGVVAWGDKTFQQTNVPPDLTNSTVSLAAGYFHSMAIKTDGTGEAWGDNGFGQTTLPVTAISLVQLSGGDLHTVALFADGTVTAVGDNTYGQTTVPSGLNGVIAIASGGYHNLALTTNGTVVAWGANNSGQINVPGANNIVAIAAGFAHSMALRNDGALLIWGDNTYGQANIPAAASNIVAIAAGRYYCLALRRDGTLVAWGDNSANQLNIPASVTNIVALAAGNSHCLALRTDGRIFAWGLNNYGQTNAPITSNYVALAAGEYHSLAMSADNPPVASIQNIFNSPTNNLIVITLNATDPDPADTNVLTFRILSIPVLGTLYQFNPATSNRGPAILTTNVLVTDVKGRVVFVPNPGGYGVPYASFQYLANDQVYDSAPGTVNINIPGKPVVTTLLPVQFSRTNVTLNGIIFPNLSNSIAFFQWGLTTNYGSNTVPTNIAGAVASSSVFTNVLGLLTATNYHYRIVGSNFFGTNVGADMTFMVPVAAYSLTNSVVTNSGTFKFAFTGSSNATYSVWASTNLATWIKLGTATQPTPGNFLYQDLAATNYPSRFYKVIWP